MNNPELSEGGKMVVHQPTKVETPGDPLGHSRKSPESHLNKVTKLFLE